MPLYQLKRDVIMSRFDELCNVYKEYRDGLSDFRMASFQFGRRLIGGYVKYLGASDMDYKVKPLNKEPEPNMKYSTPGAMHLDDDAYWHLGFFLTIHIDKNTYPKQELRIEFVFKPISDSVYTVSFLGVDGPFLNVDVNSDESFNAIYEQLQTVITKMYKDELDYLRGKTHKLTTIGFVQGGSIAGLNKEMSE